MSLPDHEILELDALCSAAAEERLNETQQRRLAELLAGSEDARRFYVRYMGLSASLCQYAGELQVDAEPGGATATVAWGWFRLWKRALASFATAAVVALVIWGAFQFLGNPEERAITLDTASDTFVARVTGAEQGQWEGQARGTQVGDPLRRGQRLELKSGTAELTFDSGAQIVLEGPAVIRLNSAWDATLDRGALRAIVPPEAVGFRIVNPTVEIVDLGTEFSVIVDDAGATEVFVHQGAVEAAALSKKGNRREAIVLREKQSRRFGRTETSAIRNPEHQFTRLSRKVASERFVRAAAFVHWSFESIEENPRYAAPALSATGWRSMGAVDRAGKLDATSLAPARWGNGIVLDGETVMEAKVTGFSASPRGAITILFWLRTPPEAPLRETGPLLAWQGSAATVPVEVLCNRNASEGALGAIRTESGRGFVVGATPLRDGRWHHVAVVLVAGNRPNAPWQVKQYVDGRLETITAKQTRRRQNPALARTGGDSTQSLVLWLGGRPDSAGRAEPCFRGELDELFVVDRALTPAEIRHIMKENSLPASVRPLLRGSL